MTAKSKVLTIHADKPTINRFKTLFGRWKEFQIQQDENANPTQKEYLNTLLDLSADELGVDL